MKHDQKMATQHAISCAHCGADSGNILFSARDFDGRDEYYKIYQCKQCHLVQTTPVPDQDQLSKIYDLDYYGDKSSKFSYLIEKWALYAAKDRARKLLRLHGNKSRKLRILDVGCGRGVLLKAFQSLGHEVIGVERQDSPFADISGVVCGDLEILDLEEEYFDVIVLWHVLEHLDAPATTLAKIRNLLKNNGSLFISVPNFGSYQASLFSKHWFHLDLPRHLLHFSEESLSVMLKKAGMKVTHKNTFSFDQNSYGFLQSALNIIPGFKNNHFYSLLKSGLSPKSLFLLLAYSPLIALVSIAASIELIISILLNNGASLNLQVKKNHHD